MESPNKDLESILNDAILLGKFKSFCDYNDTKEKQSRLRTIFSRSLNYKKTIINLFNNEIKETVSDHEAERLYPLIQAFLNKSKYRKQISDSIKIELLKQQNNCCAICGKPIDISSHADHIIPFKYVGDELSNNLQMLCSKCNTQKNASFDYQIRFLLKLCRS